MKFNKIGQVNQIFFEDDDLFAISDIGGLIAQFKKGEIIFFKLNGDFHKKIKFYRRFIKKIYWIGSNLIFIALYFVQIFDYKKEKVTDRIHIAVLGHSVKNDKFLILTSDGCHIFGIEQNKFVAIETCSFSRASNKFNFIESLISTKRSKNDSDLYLIDGLKVKNHKVKNEVRNQLVEIERMKPKEDSVRSLLKTNTHMIKDRSIKGKYSGDQLELVQGQKTFTFRKYNLRSIRIKGKLILYTVDSRLWLIVRPDHIKKLHYDVLYLEIFKDGAFIIALEGIFWMRFDKKSRNETTRFLLENGIFRFSDRIEDIVSILEDFHDKKIILKLFKINRMNVQKYFEKYFNELCTGNLGNKEIIDELNSLLNEHKISHFYDLAIMAQSVNRASVANFLITREKNFMKKMNFYLRIGDQNGIVTSVIEQDNILLVNNFFVEMHKKFSIDEIINVTRDEKVFVKYKNFLKHFKEKYLVFLNKCSEYQDIIYDNLLKSSVDLTKLPQKEFDVKMLQILYKFYFLRNAIFNDHENQDITTVDSAVKLLLENNDKKNAFLLKYSSVMSKEKFKHLQETLSNKQERS